MVRASVCIKTDAVDLDLFDLLENCRKEMDRGLILILKTIVGFEKTHYETLKLLLE